MKRPERPASGPSLLGSGLVWPAIIVALFVTNAAVVALTVYLSQRGGVPAVGAQGHAPGGGAASAPRGGAR